MGVRHWTLMHVPVPALFGVLACARGCTPLKVERRGNTGHFRCILLVHVGVCLWTWIQVPLPAVFGVFALFTWVYASRRGSTFLNQLFSVCTPSARGCTHLDVDPQALTDRFRRVRPVYMGVHRCT